MARINHEAIKANQYSMTHNWNFILKRFPSGLSNPSRYAGLLAENGILNLHMETTGIPNAAVNVAEGKIRGITVKQPSDTAPDGVFSGTFLDRDDYLVSEFFDAWRQLGSNRTSGIQLPKNQVLVYSDCDLHLLDGEGNTKAKYRPFNLYPNNVVLTDLSGDADYQRVTVDFNYTTFDRLNENDEII